LTIDGYPATHFRWIRVASNGDQSQYDTYVLDTRMRYRQSRPTFLSFRFSSSPPAADALSGLQREILASVKLDEEWASEVPVQREQPSTDPRAPAAASRVPATVGAPGRTAPSVDRREPAGPPAAPSADGPDGAPEPTPAADTRQTDDVEPRAVTDDRAMEEPPVDSGVTTPAAAETGQAADGSRQEGADAAEARRLDYEAARALRDEGAGLQRQGDLRGAIERYRQSLEKYPDERLEAYIQQLEALLQPQR